MKRKGVYALVSGIIAVVVVALVLTLVVFPNTTGMEDSQLSKPDAASALLAMNPDPVPEDQEMASSPGSSQEGIKVHGHWTIAVYNPDGTLAELREFDNALTPDGAIKLVQIMGRVLDVNGWRIILRGNPVPFAGNVAVGNIVESSWPGDEEDYLFKSLEVDVIGQQLVLSGTAIASQDGNIDKVETHFHYSYYGSNPDNPYDNLVSRMFTETSITSVDVSPGQSVAVTVVISFS